MSDLEGGAEFLSPAERAWADRCRRRFVMAPATQVQPRALVLLGTGSTATLVEEAAREWFRKQGGCALTDANLLAHLHPLGATTSEETLEQTCGTLALQLLDEALERRVNLLVRLPMIWDIPEDLGAAPRLEELPETLVAVLEAWVGRLTDEGYLCEILAVPESTPDESPNSSPWDDSRLIRITTSPTVNLEDAAPAVEVVEEDTTEPPVYEPNPIEVDNRSATVSERMPRTSEPGRAERMPTGVGFSMGGNSPDTRTRPTTVPQNPRSESPLDPHHKTDPTLDRLRAMQANIRRLADAGPE